MDAVVFSEEQREELHKVEAQIRRRVAIGAHVSERKLVDELVRVGLSEQLVRRALAFMASQVRVWAEAGDAQWKPEPEKHSLV